MSNIKPAYPSITTFFNIAVGTPTIRALSGDKRRTGYVLCNRSATIVYVGNNESVSAGSGATIRLLQNEILTILESEGDNPTRDVWVCASAASVLEIIESVRY